MNIKSKIKSAWDKLTRKGHAKKVTDSELGADEVIQEEVFPKKTAQKRKTCTSKKPPSKRTRPTNGNYQMIDPDGDTCDSSKS